MTFSKPRSRYRPRGVDRNPRWPASAANPLKTSAAAPAVIGDLPWSGLTFRQLGVLRLAALGRSTKEIARELSISPKTVETYRAQVMTRTGLETIADLVRYAIRQGLISAWD